MGLYKPKPFIYPTRDFGENIRSVCVAQCIRFIDCVTGLMSKGGQRLGNRLNVSMTISDGQRILFKAGTGRGGPRSAFRDTTQLHNTLGNQIDLR
jgi:hypothetical protein